MSELDVAKEQIAYLKLWLGIMVVTDISLIGWFVGNYGEASTNLLVADLLVSCLASSLAVYCRQCSPLRGTYAPAPL
jgi:hypothetical protein